MVINFVLLFVKIICSVLIHETKLIDKRYIFIPAAPHINCHELILLSIEDVIFRLDLDVAIREIPA